MMRRCIASVAVFRSLAFPSRILLRSIAATVQSPKGSLMSETTAEHAAERDGFVISTHEGEEVAFVACAHSSESMRVRVLSGLLRNMDTDRFCVGDTRDAS